MIVKSIHCTVQEFRMFHHILKKIFNFAGVCHIAVVALCLRRPDEVKRSLESLEKAWDNYQVYLKDEINFIDEDMLNTPLQAPPSSPQHRRLQLRCPLLFTPLYLSTYLFFRCPI